MSDKKKQEELWEGLHKGWVVDDSSIREKGAMTFRKGCAFFDVVLSEVEPGRWNFEIFESDGKGPYQTYLKADTAEAAQSAAMYEIFDVLAAGPATFGIRIGGTVPHDEIRVKQIAIGSHDTIYGITEDGLVFERQVTMGGARWELVDMKAVLTKKE